MDLEKYRSLFIGETREYLQSMSHHILQMEDAADSGDLDTLLRAAHSIKGMSASMGYTEIRDVSHLLENLLGKLRMEEVPPQERIRSVLLQGVDLVGQMVDEIEKSGTVTIRSDAFRNVITLLSGTSKVKQNLGQATARETHQQVAGKVGTVRVDSTLIDRVMEGLGELMIHHEALQESDPENPEIGRIRTLTQQLYTYATDLRMLPFEILSQQFPRIVHDLGARFQKEIRLQMEGTGIRMDKAVLDEVADPLIHLIRNAVDHGIETPEHRVRMGKNRAGTLGISLTKQGDRFLIRVEDDGGGLDPQLIRETAIQRGLIQERVVPYMNLREILMLITHPGFSTAAEVSDISGRGIGMDVVRSKIDALGGTLKIESEPSKFTRFDILIPFTLAVIPALMIRLEQLLCAVPFSRIERFLQISKKDVHTVRGRPVFFSENAILYIEKLWSILRRVHGDYELPDSFPVFVTEHHNRRIAWAVDELIAEKDILVKPLGEPLSHLGCYNGASVSSKGDVVPLLDLENLYRELFV